MIFSSPVPLKACMLFAGRVMKISCPSVGARGACFLRDGWWKYHAHLSGLEVHAFCGTGDENIMPTCRSAGNYYMASHRQLGLGGVGGLSDAFVPRKWSGAKDTEKGSAFTTNRVRRTNSSPNIICLLKPRNVSNQTYVIIPLIWSSECRYICSKFSKDILLVTFYVQFEKRINVQRLWQAASHRVSVDGLTSTNQNCQNKTAGYLLQPQLHCGLYSWGGLWYRRASESPNPPFTYVGNWKKGPSHIHFYRQYKLVSLIFHQNRCM